MRIRFGLAARMSRSTTGPGGVSPLQRGPRPQEPDASGAELIEFRGYAYTREPSPISGDLVTVYDPSTSANLEGSVPESRSSPRWSLERRSGAMSYRRAMRRRSAASCRCMGSLSSTVPEVIDDVRVEVFRATRANFSTAPFEGRMRASFEGKWTRESHNIADGALVRADRTTSGAARHGVARTAGPRLTRGLGIFQRLLRAEGAYGTLRG